MVSLYSSRAWGDSSRRNVRETAEPTVVCEHPVERSLAELGMTGPPWQKPEHVNVQTKKLRINRTHDSRAKKYSLYPSCSWYGGSLSAVDTRAWPRRGHGFFPWARYRIFRDWRVHLLLVCIRFRLIRE